MISGPDQGLNGVQQALVAQQGKYGRSKVVFGVRIDRGGVDRNGDVERPWVKQPGFAGDGDRAPVKGQLVIGAGDLAVAEHALGFPVENLGVLVHDRLQVLVGGQDAAGDDEAVAVEIGQLFGCEVHGGMSESKFLRV